MIQQKTFFAKEYYLHIFVFVFSLVLAVVNLILKLNVTPAWFNGILEQNHQLLLNFEYTNNEQSRLFQFYIPEFISISFRVSIPTAYIIQRLVFTTITFVVFYYYSRKWFNPLWSLICILIMAIVMARTYKNHLQESAPLMSLTFVIILWAIREKKELVYVLALLIGGVNNETTLFLPAVYFFVNFESFKMKSISKVIIKTILLALPAYVVVGIIRYITKDQPHLGGALHWEENIGNMHLLFQVYSVLWILALLPIKTRPEFLKRCLYTIPLFILPHMITGIISETRQMVPLSFIVIPSALCFFIPQWDKLCTFFKKGKFTS